MIQIDHEGKQYTGRTEWGDITLAQFIELSKIPIPEKLRAYFIGLGQLSDLPESEKAYTDALAAITETDWLKNFPKYYGEVFSVLTDMPKEAIDTINGETRSEMFERFFRHFIMTLCYDIPMMTEDGKQKEYIAPKMDSFDIEGETFYFPKSLRIMGADVPMAGEDVVTFSEGADIELAIRSLAQEGLEKFPMFMAVYCRKEGEKYSEDVVMSREELFLKTPMDAVWSLFFYTEELTLTSTLTILQSLNRVSQAARSLEPTMDLEDSFTKSQQQEFSEG
jgi:hypothetical protein